MITVLCGGVGAARMLRALAEVVAPEATVGIVNTGDDTVLHGLSISPDLDTITYTLAGAIDPERGWGLRDESWRAMAALARYAAVRPARSTAAPTWFNLGDQDLATHFYRTARLREGATLTAVTAEIAAAWGLRQRLLPMCDETGVDDRHPGRGRHGHLVPGVLRRAPALGAGVGGPLRRRRRGHGSPLRRRRRCRWPTPW